MYESNFFKMSDQGNKSICSFGVNKKVHNLITVKFSLYHKLYKTITDWRNLIQVDVKFLSEFTYAIICRGYHLLLIV